MYLGRLVEMKEPLTALGFTNGKEAWYGKSSVPGFNGIDTPGTIRKMHSAVIEARKPW